jgi:hypothetical protein
MTLPPKSRLKHSLNFLKEVTFLPRLEPELVKLLLSSFLLLRPSTSLYSKKRQVKENGTLVFHAVLFPLPEN